MLTPEERARTARRIVVRAGFAFMFVASAAACIFDQGPDYKGGGRRNSGAEVVTGSATATDTATGTATDTTGLEDGGFPFPDGANPFGG